MGSIPGGGGSGAHPASLPNGYQVLFPWW